MESEESAESIAKRFGISHNMVYKMSRKRRNGLSNHSRHGSPVLLTTEAEVDLKSRMTGNRVSWTDEDYHPTFTFS